MAKLAKITEQKPTLSPEQHGFYVNSRHSDRCRHVCHIRSLERWAVHEPPLQIQLDQLFNFRTEELIDQGIGWDEDRWKMVIGLCHFQFPHWKLLFQERSGESLTFMTVPCEEIEAG